MIKGSIQHFLHSGPHLCSSTSPPWGSNLKWNKDKVESVILNDQNLFCLDWGAVKKKDTLYLMGRWSHQDSPWQQQCLSDCLRYILITCIYVSDLFLHWFVKSQHLRKGLKNTSHGQIPLALTPPHPHCGQDIPQKLTKIYLLKRVYPLPLN